MFKRAVTTALAVVGMGLCSMGEVMPQNLGSIRVTTPMYTAEQVDEIVSESGKSNVALTNGTIYINGDTITPLPTTMNDTTATVERLSIVYPGWDTNSIAPIRIKHNEDGSFDLQIIGTNTYLFGANGANLYWDEKCKITSWGTNELWGYTKIIGDLNTRSFYIPRNQSILHADGRFRFNETSNARIEIGGQGEMRVDSPDYIKFGGIDWSENLWNASNKTLTAYISDRLEDFSRNGTVPAIKSNDGSYMIDATGCVWRITLVENISDWVLGGGGYLTTSSDNYPIWYYSTRWSQWYWTVTNNDSVITVDMPAEGYAAQYMVDVNYDYYATSLGMWLLYEDEEEYEELIQKGFPEDLDFTRTVVRYFTTNLVGKIALEEEVNKKRNYNDISVDTNTWYLLKPDLSVEPMIFAQQTHRYVRWSTEDGNFDLDILFSDSTWNLTVNRGHTIVVTNSMDATSLEFTNYVPPYETYHVIRGSRLVLNTELPQDYSTVSNAAMNAGPAATNYTDQALIDTIKLSESKPEENPRLVFWDFDATWENPRLAHPTEFRVSDIVPGNYEAVSNAAMNARAYTDITVNTNSWFLINDDGNSGNLAYISSRKWGNQQYELSGGIRLDEGFWWTLKTNNIPFVSIQGNLEDNSLYFSDNTNSFTLVRGSRFALDTETKGYLPLTGGTLIGDLFATQIGSDVALIAQDSTNAVAVGMGFGSDGLWPMNKENDAWTLLSDYRFWFNRTENRWVLNSLTVDQEDGNAEVSIKGTLGQGTNVVASGAYSHAEGVRTTSQSYGSHAEGVDTQAKMSYAHAEGNSTEAGGSASHAEGIRSQTTAYGSHAEGVDTKATSNYAHAEGNGTDAGGASSHAEGVRSKTTAYGSHAGGVDAIASNNYSYVWQGSTGQTYGSHGIGTFNLNPANGLYGLFVGDTNIVDAIRASILSKADETNYIYEVDTTVPIDDATNPPPTRVVTMVSKPSLRSSVETVVTDSLLKPNSSLSGFSLPEYLAAINKYEWDYQTRTCYRKFVENDMLILRAVTNIDLTAIGNINALKAMEDSIEIRKPPVAQTCYSVGYASLTNVLVATNANFKIDGNYLAGADITISYDVSGTTTTAIISPSSITAATGSITIAESALATARSEIGRTITFTIQTAYGNTSITAVVAEPPTP